MIWYSNKCKTILTKRYIGSVPSKPCCKSDITLQYYLLLLFIIQLINHHNQRASVHPISLWPVWYLRCCYEAPQTGRQALSSDPVGYGPNDVMKHTLINSLSFFPVTLRGQSKGQGRKWVCMQEFIAKTHRGRGRGEWRDRQMTDDN